MSVWIFKIHKYPIKKSYKCCLQHSQQRCRNKLCQWLYWHKKYFTKFSCWSNHLLHFYKVSFKHTVTKSESLWKILPGTTHYWEILPASNLSLSGCNTMQPRRLAFPTLATDKYLWNENIHHTAGKWKRQASSKQGEKPRGSIHRRVKALGHKMLKQFRELFLWRAKKKKYHSSLVEILAQIHCDNIRCRLQLPQNWPLDGWHAPWNIWTSICVRLFVNIITTFKQQTFGIIECNHWMEWWISSNKFPLEFDLLLTRASDIDASFERQRHCKQYIWEMHSLVQTCDRTLLMLQNWQSYIVLYCTSKSRTSVTFNCTINETHSIWIKLCKFDSKLKWIDY